MNDNQKRRVSARRIMGLSLLATVLFYSCGQIDPGQTPEPPAFATAPTSWAALQGNKDAGKTAAKTYCLGCHVIDGEGHQLSTAPSFETGMNEDHITPAYLRRWLWNPPAVKPQTIMPNLSLEPEVIEDLVAFLAQYRDREEPELTESAPAVDDTEAPASAEQ